MYWNSPDKYLEHLKCFHSVCMPDFSIATGDRGMMTVTIIYGTSATKRVALCMIDTTL